jgi:hypothetical protein
LVGDIDCWVNVTMGEQEPPPGLIRVKEDDSERGDERLFFAPHQPRLA